MKGHLMHIANPYIQDIQITNPNGRRIESGITNY